MPASIIVAKFPGTCRACGYKFPAGTKVNFLAGAGATHLRCADGARDGARDARPPELDFDALDAGEVEELDPFAAAVAASRAESSELDVPCPPGRTFRDYQLAGIAYMFDRLGVIVADEMGLGKTPQFVGLCNVDTTIRSVLVICPKSLTLNWVREWDRWSITGQRAHRVGAPGWENAAVVIASFEEAKKHEELFGSREWSIVGIDEAHRVKNKQRATTKADREKEQAELDAAAAARGRTTKKKARKRVAVQRTHAVLAALRHARRKVLMTGTPIENRPKELFPLLQIVCPEVWDPKGGGGFMAYARRYCDAKRVPIPIRGGKGAMQMVWKYDGASRLPELQERLRATCLLRRLKRDVLAELPPKIRQIIELEPGRLAAKFVEREARMQGTSGTWLQEYMEALARLGEGAAKIGFQELAAARVALAEAKVDAVADHVESLLGDGAKKVLVGAWHHAMIDGLAAALEKHGVVTITGGQTVEQRQASVDAFQAPGGPRVALGQIDAAGVGYTLTAASHVVLAELPWTPAQLSQFEDRCHRFGQTEPVVVHHTVFRGSLDAKMAALLVEKQRVAELALDAR